MKRLKNFIQTRGRWAFRTIWQFTVLFNLLWIFTGTPASALRPTDVNSMTVQVQSENGQTSGSPILFFILGDSLSHGTMDATNNETNTSNAYVQLLADALVNSHIPLYFQQPFFDDYENRLEPFVVPTNLGVDGSDIFSLVGLEYYKRVGADESIVSPDLIADRWLPRRLTDKYDKVLYPINVFAKKPVSQLSAADWLIRDGAPMVGIKEAIGILWEGNNDSSLAALGAGGRNPMFQPMPFDVVRAELKPALQMLLAFGEQAGVLSFEPYTQAAIERNLTEINDFEEQYRLVVDRLESAVSSSTINADLFLLTLPYYSAVGYLMDSDDIEFYLQKLDPTYEIPQSFKRVKLPDEPLTGDRISLLTFGLMYAFLSAGHSVEEVNQVLETDGKQYDGLVLSEAEQQFIMTRIDAFNEAIKVVAAASGPNVHVIDIGQLLNNALIGKDPIVVDGRVLNRKWIRGNGFCLDGVHPGYLGQALIANIVLPFMNSILGFEAELYNLSEIMMIDPYIDQDLDGWAPGPQYEATGITELLFLFKDPDDNDPGVQVELPADVWDLISDILLEEFLPIPEIYAEAKQLGIISE